MENKGQEVAWYVTIYSQGLSRTYNFISDKERDSMYDFLIDRNLRNQSVQINDCKGKEVILLPSTSTVIKGEMYLEMDVGIEDDSFIGVEFHKIEELVLNVMGFRG